MKINPWPQHCKQFFRGCFDICLFWASRVNFNRIIARQSRPFILRAHRGGKIKSKKMATNVKHVYSRWARFKVAFGEAGLVEICRIFMVSQKAREHGLVRFARP
jgi:hypothetical protein